MTGGDGYRAFLASKRVAAEASGFAVSDEDINPTLFGFQREIVRWALGRGKAAAFTDPGTGKTLIQLEWARHVCRHTGGDVLILAPLAVSHQTAREAAKLDLEVRVCKTGADARPGVTITNYERLQHFDPSRFAGLVLDECFPAGTLVDTPTGRKMVQDVRIDDRIFNASGVDVVADVHRREVQYAVRIGVNGRAIISSPNHAYFTGRGWVCAQDFIPGDQIMATSEAMRMVRDRVCGPVCTSGQKAVLQSILLSEMADEPAGVSSEGLHGGASSEYRSGGARLVRIGGAERAREYRTHSDAEPGRSARGAGEDIPHIESHEAQTFRAWGQREWFDSAATDHAGCARTELGGGISFVVGRADSRLSHVLQTRLGESRAANQYRGGWSLPLLSERGRPETGCDGAFARVDSLEVLEPGHPDLESLRDAAGKLYFYDLSATWHPSFSINGLLVHNSSCLKAFGSVERRRLTEFGRRIGYRLCCTATPAPNDLVELTNHAEFLEVMQGKEIIALWFTQDGNTTHKWRLKGHAREEFWRWMASWSVALRRPSDLGYADDGFLLPPLRMHQETVESAAPAGRLFAVEAQSLEEQRAARKASLPARVRRCAELVDALGGTWLLWCDLNAESTALARAIPGAEEVTGSDPPERKERALLDFAEGRIPVLVSKPSLAGFGMNWQHCHQVAFVGLSYSYEQVYQAIRRCWRYGQRSPVDCYVITSEAEGNVVKVIERKEAQAAEMMDQIVRHTAGLSLGRAGREEMAYEEETARGRGWTLHLGDSVEGVDRIATGSVGLALTSPPFPSMYAYTNSARDLGNVAGIDQMLAQFRFLVGRDKLLRALMPGRLFCVHLMQLTAMQSREGYVGLHDYRGKVIRLMGEEGWVYAGEVTIDKNPQIQATRNKERGLLFKTLATDSSLMRMALADYLLYFRAPGKNPAPIRAGVSQRYDNRAGWITEQEWVEWAAPVWYRQTKGLPGGIRETDVLNVAQAREADDERHLCPLQLGVIERAVKLWSNPGELVYDPFAGLSSVGVKALALGRRFVGGELKRSYFESGVRNLTRAAELAHRPTLFDHEEAAG